MPAQPVDYRSALMRFASAIRDPDNVHLDEIEERRMKIYQELFFNNIEGFLASAFPVFKSLIPEAWWQREVRGFIQHHRCHSPLFYDISREYLDYVESDRRPATPEDPPFMQELLHYEWVELALEIAEDPSTITPELLTDDLLGGHPVRSELAWFLEYQFPVHKINRDHLPSVAPELPTWLLVYRPVDQPVAFMELNVFSARLLALIDNAPELSGKQILEQLAQESGATDSQPVLAGGKALLNRFFEQGILVGAVPIGPER